MKQLLISFVVLCFVFSFGMNSIFLETASAASPVQIESDMKISIPKGAVIDKTEVTTEWGSPYYYLTNIWGYATTCIGVDYVVTYWH